MLIQIPLIIFVVAVIFLIILKFKKGDLSWRELIAWLALWILVGLAVLWPHKTDEIAQFLGVERGANLLIYLSILALFYLMFKILVKIEKIERRIAQIIRHISLKDDDQN
jgi:hypothetical protein